jgi:hypothetical protein
MTLTPDVTVVALSYGPYPDAAALNPRLPSDRPLLLATLDIDWSPPDPASEIARLEETLVGLSPGLAAHQCRGLPAYHVFLGARRAARPGEAGSGAGRGVAPGAGADAPGPAPYDARLAFAHLVEHAVIDFQCSITGRTRLSGVTGAHAARDGRYDILVESTGPRVGNACLALAAAWLTEAAGGRRLGDAEREILSVAAWLHARDGGAWSAPLVSLALGLSEIGAGRALAALADVGYLEAERATMSLDDVREYRVPRG